MKKENLFNLKTLLLIFILGLASCSSAKNDNIFVLNASYIHLIENCDNTNNPEINCTESIEFNESGIVNVLIGGGDIIYQTNFSISESKIEFEKSTGLDFDISFIIIDDLTLKRIEDGEIWVKEI